MTLKQLTFRLKKKSACRNSSRRIIVFHRGGGSKQFHPISIPKEFEKIQIIRHQKRYNCRTGS